MSTADSNDFDDENEDDRRTGPLGLNQLNVPLEPLIDIVFVHGVGGGSRKSWSKSIADDHYWPQAWLPRDLDFQNVRIHAFGYTSAKSQVVKTIAAIPDIANSLLIAMRDSLALRSSSNPVILVGHSMGGLVIKKASETSESSFLADIIRPSSKHVQPKYTTIWLLASKHYTSSERLIEVRVSPRPSNDFSDVPH